MSISQQLNTLMSYFVPFQISCGLFYRKTRCKTTIIPADPHVSDDEDFDDDDQDPDYVPEPHNLDMPCESSEPSVKKRRAMPLFEEEEDNSELIEGNSEDDEEQSEKTNSKGQSNTKEKNKSKCNRTLQARPTTWTKVDIDNPPLPIYIHEPPLFLLSPSEYFFKFFSQDLVKHITFQTNLYATQKDISTTNETEILHFAAILLYMGVVTCPSLDDYWAMSTRVPQVAEIMSSKRFRLLRRTIHFNDNSQVHESIDRFFKVRPLFSHLNEAFQRVPQTPKQSIDEVMVGYKGKNAGNLRQYIKNKPDKWGFKLFKGIRRWIYS